MNDRERKFEAYKVAISVIDLDNRNLWSTFGAFLVAETILLGFALTNLFSTATKITVPGSHLGPFLASILGLVLCVPWAVTNYRAATLRDLRIAQARALEEDPSHLLRDGKMLADCGEVTLGTETFRLSFFAHKPFNNTFWTRFLIGSLATADAIVAALSGFWWHS